MEISYSWKNTLIITELFLKNVVDLTSNLKKTKSLNLWVTYLQRSMYRMHFSLPVLYNWKVKQGNVLLQITFSGAISVCMFCKRISVKSFTEIALKTVSVVAIIITPITLPNDITIL